MNVFTWMILIDNKIYPYNKYLESYSSGSTLTMGGITSRWATTSTATFIPEMWRARDTTTGTTQDYIITRRLK